MFVTEVHRKIHPLQLLLLIFLLFLLHVLVHIFPLLLQDILWPRPSTAQTFPRLWFSVTRIHNRSTAISFPTIGVSLSVCCLCKRTQAKTTLFVINPNFLNAVCPVVLCFSPQTYSISCWTQCSWYFALHLSRGHGNPWQRDTGYKEYGQQISIVTRRNAP